MFYRNSAKYLILELANVAYKKPATQSSTYHNSFGSPDDVVDGNSDGYYHGSTCLFVNSVINPWWRVDLQAVYRVHKVKTINKYLIEPK